MGFLDTLRSKGKTSPDEAISVLSKSIFKCALIAAGEINKNYSDEHGGTSINSGLYWQIIFHFQFLFLHITDRTAFAIWGAEKRSDFMNFLDDVAMGATIDAAYSTNDARQKLQHKERLLHKLNQFNLQYGRYKKMFADKNESAEGTLFWEFGKNLSKLVTGDSDNIIYMMLSMSLATTALKTLKINDTLQNIS